MYYKAVIIEGFKVTKNKDCFKIARLPIGQNKAVVATSFKSPQDAFNKFVAKCEERGINYKTDFRTLGVTNQKLDTVVTPELAPVVTQKSFIIQDVIINETYGFSLKLKGATPLTLKRVNYHIVRLFKDEAFISKLKDGSIFNEKLTLRSSEVYFDSNCEDEASHALLSAFGDYISDLICETFNVWFKGDYPENFRLLLMVISNYYVEERTSLRMR